MTLYLEEDTVEKIQNIISFENQLATGGKKNISIELEVRFGDYENEGKFFSGIERDQMLNVISRLNKDENYSMSNAASSVSIFQIGRNNVCEIISNGNIIYMEKKKLERPLFEDKK